jgi:hypothetical protein
MEMNILVFPMSEADFQLLSVAPPCKECRQLLTGYEWIVTSNFRVMRKVSENFAVIMKNMSTFTHTVMTSGFDTDDVTSRYRLLVYLLKELKLSHYTPRRCLG